MLTNDRSQWYYKNLPRKMLHAETGMDRVRKADKKFCKKFQKKVLTSCGRYDSISTLRVQQHRTQDTAPWQINSNATLKIQEKKFLKIFQRVSDRYKPNSKCLGKRIQKKPSLFWSGSNEEVTNYYSRVWSWLRMNAGGVLNTCKSNGDNIFEAISLLRAEMLLS